VGLDLAILPIGDNYTMGPDDSIRALEYLRPAVVIPCHYNTWPVIAVDVASWADRVRSETSAQPVVLAVEESFSL
jgi:L-ascorbate metabolism protein UlaG (beta-lactamase superfamily)